MNRCSRIWMFLLLATLILPSALLAGGKDKESNEAAVARNLTIFNSLYKELAVNYVDTIDPDKTITTAVNAMLSQLDPYTEYIKAEDREDFMMVSTGEYGGIGSVIMQTENGVVISEPYENSPAALAGLVPGDRIMMIDGDSVAGWNTSKVSERLKGQANTNVRVTVCRPYAADSIHSFDIIRKKIQIPSVPYYDVIGNAKR